MVHLKGSRVAEFLVILSGMDSLAGFIPSKTMNFTLIF